MSKGTVHRTVRIDDGMWDAAGAKANREGRSLSGIIREALSGYIGGPSELMAKAWDEGYTAGSNDEENSYWGPSAVTTPNPYHSKD